MILVDTSVRVDHLRTGDELLAGLLQDSGPRAPLGHREMALGSLAQRGEVVGVLHATARRRSSRQRTANRSPATRSAWCCAAWSASSPPPFLPIALLRVGERSPADSS
ncbi:MAG: hypothetical protein M3P95_02695 [Actinomycetota bacterium]|nr:hypothetical protein [Actinomycetota bacterium]